MTTPAAPSAPFPSFFDPTGPLYACGDDDRELFDRRLRHWMPPDGFDAHAHLYDLRHLHPDAPRDAFGPSSAVGFEVYRRCCSAWMGDRAPADGVFFAFPAKQVDFAAANAFLHREVRDRPGSRGLLLIGPHHDPGAIERQVVDERWAGFKVYHVYAAGNDTFRAPCEAYLPEWSWELADRHGLAIMLHIVLDRALADPRNETYLVEHLRRYPHARLVLAHAGRGFCAAHTFDAVETLRTFDNVWFDTSAICEPLPFEAILRTFGPRRLMFGTDFPVSSMRARPVSLGDGFWWMYDTEIDWKNWSLGRPRPCGLESLIALQHACRATRLRDGDVERIFRDNARELLGLQRPTATKTQQLYDEAKRLIPGATQLLSKRAEMYAPNRWPAYYAEARGCRVVDLDGREYLDFATSGIGSCLLGYAHPEVTAAVVRRVELGSMSTLNSPEEVELARRLIGLHPWAEAARFARSGGEALAVATRIARASTGRDVIAVCGYHGWSDWYLAANLGDDRSLDGHLLPGLQPAGVPRGLRGTVVTFPYNQIDALKQIVVDHGANLAAVVMEPTRNVDPLPGFPADVRTLCDAAGARLVFDEVTAGFRFGRGGAHLQYGVAPDLAVFAKALGNGHPIAAVIGRKAVMDAAQSSFISSTYWTEGVGPTAALSVLDVLTRHDVPRHIATIGARFRDGCADLARRHRVPLQLGGHPALTYVSFDHPDGAALLTLLTVRMLERGFLAAGGFYPSLAHEPRHVEAFLAAAAPVFAELREALERGDAVQRLGGAVKHSGFARLT